MDYPKRLIEVDLPIKRISAHARREKSIRHGHISTLHIWWARRPLAACRAVICASLWPDPADENCPQAFRDAAARLITEFAEKVYNTTSLHATASKESFGQWEGIVAARAKGIDLDPNDPAHLNKLRFALLDFIADFANWDNSTVREYLDTSRALTQAAHEALGGAPGSRPLVVDPFAGGGSIPLEALRVGADAFASDLNPVAVLLNKVVLEYIPMYGQKLADEVRKWGERIKGEAEKELARFYPKDADGATPIAYFWARMIRCEGPGCGAEVPMITQPVLAVDKSSRIFISCVPDRQKKTIEVMLESRPKTEEVLKGTVNRSSVTCPVCGYTTPSVNVRKQFTGREGGILDAKLLAVATISFDGKKKYRAPTIADQEVVDRARLQVSTIVVGPTASIPDEPLPYLRSIFNIQLLGVTRWGQLFTPRQALLLTGFAGLIRETARILENDPPAAAAITCLGLALDKMADFHTSLARWIRQGEKLGNTFARQALGIIWDYAEANPFANFSGSWDRCISYVAEVIEHSRCLDYAGIVQQSSATEHPLPDDSGTAFVTDPPYYDAVPYADLSDFFYVWLKRSIGPLHPILLDKLSSPKTLEIVQLAERNELYAYKTRENFERLMSVALSEGRRVTFPTGIGVIVFAHKTTLAWETMLQAVIDAGWIVVASWPIDTERQGRLRAMDSAALASSVHLVCRPRENSDGSLLKGDIGDWRDILQELPPRIHAWLPRLAGEGVVGADAIFACLGPALEIFSRYSRVERADGTPVSLREYLEQVWAAVAKEALSLLFKDADASGLEPDSRVTAMWLWTLRTEADDKDDKEVQEVENEEDEDEKAGKSPAKGGFVLEFDAARKIAQGLGANLEELRSVVEVKGQTARLLPVGERAVYLLGKPSLGIGSAPAKGSRRKARTSFLPGMEDVEKGSLRTSHESGDGDELGAFGTGTTTLDRIHQAMLLFAQGRSDALKRFLVDDGIGKEARFWKLAQSLSALYPSGTDEKRWVDGVLARKKGLGL